MNEGQRHERAEAVAEALKGMSWDGQVAILVETLKLAADDERRACIRDLSECVQCTKRQRDVVLCCQAVLRSREQTNVPAPVCVRQFRKERKAKMGVL
jgi:hypothetical protein